MKEAWNIALRRVHDRFSVMTAPSTTYQPATHLPTHPPNSRTAVDRLTQKQREQAHNGNQ